MTGHDIAERTRLLSHFRYAEAIEARLDLIEQAREMIDGCISQHGGTMGQNFWKILLRRHRPEVRERMLADDAEGRLLRSNSPFSTLVGVGDPEQRARLWQQAKEELSARVAPGDHPQHSGAVRPA